MNVDSTKLISKSGKFIELLFCYFFTQSKRDEGAPAGAAVLGHLLPGSLPLLEALVGGLAALRP